MTESELENLKFPIGRFLAPESISKEDINTYISEIESFPVRLKSSVKNLSDKQLDISYRSGGWTIRQVVHHCTDSHLNIYTRFKLALTEDLPAGTKRTVDSKDLV